MVPVLEKPVVGQITVKRIALALKLDEQRVAELLGATKADLTSLNQEASRATAGSSAIRSSATSTASGRSGSQGGAVPSAFTGAVQAASAAAGVPLAPLSAPSSEDGGLAGRLLGCFGDLFTASLDVGWKSEPNEDGSRPPKCMLTIANNDVTRVSSLFGGGIKMLSNREDKVVITHKYSTIPCFPVCHFAHRCGLMLRALCFRAVFHQSLQSRYCTPSLQEFK